MFTFAQIVVFVIVFILAVLGVAGIYCVYYEVKHAVIAALVAILIIGASIFATGWWNTNTASGARYLKDFHSEVNNGIEREIVITAEDGREIFRYEGKIDIESNHEDNYIKFESEEGKRYIIYYGIQDTITIIEK